MNIQKIRSIAKEHGIKTDKINKIDLIHAIQHNEGNFECFATASNQYCDQESCLWREDCFSASQPLDS